MSNKEQLVSQASKMAVIQVLAALIKDPLLFSDKNYKFDIDDFPEQFHRILFGAVQYLSLSGLQKIDYIDIDQFLKGYPVQYAVFMANQGPEYVQRAINIYDERKFNYYYNTLKKYGLLNLLIQQGIDTTDIYDPDITDPQKIADMQERFDSYSVKDIINHVDKKVLFAKEKFGTTSDIVQNQAGDGIDEYFDSLEETPVMGCNFCSPKLTTIFRGFRKGALYIESSAQGVGKSRRQAAESAHMAVSEIYDIDKREWVSTGANGHSYENPTLLISTELELKEVQTMWAAYIAGVKEDHILDCNYIADERERVKKARAIIKKAPLYFVSITDYDIDDIENLIKQYHLQRNVDYIYYDYLSTTIKIMSESSRKTKMSGLREDQILLSFVTRLKDLAKTLDVGIWTATQLSGDWKNAKEADQQLLRGARSISDKPDCCSILLPVRENDKPIIDSYCSKGFELVPTHVLHVFKVRRSRLNNVKLYVFFDRGTCRLIDCFATDKEGVMVEIENTYGDPGEKVEEKNVLIKPKIETITPEGEVIEKTIPHIIDDPLPDFENSNNNPVIHKDIIKQEKEVETQDTNNIEEKENEEENFEEEFPSFNEPNSGFDWDF
mgnify:FL=1